MDINARCNGMDRLLPIDEMIEAITHIAAKTSINKSLISPHGTYNTNSIWKTNPIGNLNVEDI